MLKVITLKSLITLEPTSKQTTSKSAKKSLFGLIRQLKSKILSRQTKTEPYYKSLISYVLSYDAKTSTKLISEELESIALYSKVFGKIYNPLRITIGQYYRR